MSNLRYLCLFEYNGVQHILCCDCFLFVFDLCLVYPMLPVSLDCPFLITPSVSLKFIYHLLQVCDVLQDLIFTEEHMQKLMTTFEQQINYANSPNETDQKKSDLWWGYTYVSGVLEGNGKLQIKRVKYLKILLL